MPSIVGVNSFVWTSIVPDPPDKIFPCIENCDDSDIVRAGFIQTH